MLGDIPGDAGAATIAGALCVNRTLKVLSFSSTTTNPIEFIAMCRAYLESEVHIRLQAYTRCSTSVPTLLVTLVLLRWLKVRK